MIAAARWPGLRHWRMHELGHRSTTRPDQDTAGFIDCETLALDKFVFERFQVRVIELKLQLEGPIRQAAPLA
jgi:hypothetical protein